jgi:hypothetical protein
MRIYRQYGDLTSLLSVLKKRKVGKNTEITSDWASIEQIQHKDLIRGVITLHKDTVTYILIIIK